jgi:hypothetical protein
MLKSLQQAAWARRTDLRWSGELLSKLPPSTLADIRHCVAAALCAETAEDASGPHPLIRSYNLHKMQVRTSLGCGVGDMAVVSLLRSGDTSSAIVIPDHRIQSDVRPGFCISAKACPSSATASAAAVSPNSFTEQKQRVQHVVVRANSEPKLCRCSPRRYRRHRRGRRPSCWRQSCLRPRAGVHCSPGCGDGASRSHGICNRRVPTCAWALASSP